MALSSASFATVRAIAPLFCPMAQYMQTTWGRPRSRERWLMMVSTTRAVFPGVAVSDDELPLAPADGGQRVHDLDPGLQRDLDGRALGHSRGDPLQGHGRPVGDRQRPAVQGVAERIDDPAEKILGNAEGEERSRGLQLHAFRDVGILGEQQDGGEVLIEVHDEPAASRPRSWTSSP